MYSGSDSNESQKYPQWALNPATYQNMTNDQVDWAALAQQWIIMKEAGPPPIPGEQPLLMNSKKSIQEETGGEAQMEIEYEREAPPAPTWDVSEPPPVLAADYWNSQQQNWNWNNSWMPPNAAPPPPTIGPQKAPLLPTPNNAYSAPPESSSDNAVPFGGYSTSSNDYNNHGYWTGSNSSRKHIKPHNKRYSKVNVPLRAPATIPPIVAQEPESPTVSSLDAAKRKQLPAWIREGLEKMEKDKLKQLIKEKQKQERDSYVDKNRPNEKETMEILKSAMKERQKSRFESDGEQSDEESSVPQKRQNPEPVSVTQDEMMLKVRRTMTEILLKVTTRHIESVCKEEHQRFLKKYKASDLRSSAPSGAYLSSRLGLGMYGEGSGSSSEEEDKSSDYQRDSRDSDIELKDTIKRKKADFQKTEKEIENRLEEAERRKEASDSRSTTPDSIDKDSQVDARVQGRKYQDERLSPLHSRIDPEKPKPRLSSVSSDASAYSKKSKHTWRSASTDSDVSYKKKKRRTRSRSKSFSPDRKYRSRWSRSKSPVKRRESNSSRRDSGSSKKKSSSRRSRSNSYSRSRRSSSSSYKRSRRSRSREKPRRTRSRSTSRSRYGKRSTSKSRSERRRRRSRSDSSSRGKRSHRH